MKNQLINGKLFASVMIILSLGMISLYGQAVGEAGPDFKVDLLGGGTFALADQQGKVVLVFLFGNSCGPCRAVGPTVESSIYQEFKNNDAFTAIGLDTWDSSSSESSVGGFRDATGITFPLAIQAGSVAAAYSTTYDRLMVIDQNGILIHKGVVLASNDVDITIDAINQSLSTVGIGDAASGFSPLRVYPVPATDVIHLEAAETIRGVVLYDVAGKLVLEESYDPGNTANSRTVSLGSLPEGLYFYTIRLEGSRTGGKLLIQR